MSRLRLIAALTLTAVLVPVASAAADPLPMPAAIKRSDKAVRAQITTVEPCFTGSSARCTTVWQSDRTTHYQYAKTTGDGSEHQHISVGSQGYALNGTCWTLDAEPAEVFDAKYGPVNFLVRNLIDVDSFNYSKIKRRSFTLKAGGRTGSFKTDSKGRMASGTVTSKQLGKTTFKVSYPSAAFTQVDPAPVCA
jgi:hypothetical protein